MSAIQSTSQLTATQVAMQVDTAVMRKALDHAEAQGDAAVSLLEAAADVQQQTIRAEPHKGGLIDMKA